LIELIKENGFCKLEDIAGGNDLLFRNLLDKNYFCVNMEDDGEVLVKLSSPKSSFSQANALLLETSNNVMKKKFISRYGKISFDFDRLFFFGEYNELIFATSLIVEYEVVDEVAKFKTLNSLYTFKILKDLPTAELSFIDKIQQQILDDEVADLLEKELDELISNRLNESHFSEEEFRELINDEIKSLRSGNGVLAMQMDRKPE
ncbi:hypothetical protein JHD48_10320, partial [Sulfurimonas sp. SAG-AH-194-I05]